MVLGLLSDTHLREPDARLEALLSGVLAPAEVLLHAGDFTAESVLDYLEVDEPRPLYAVAGNIDPGPVARRLPARRVLVLEGRRIGVIHGWGAPGGIEERVLGAFADPPDVLVFGHTHRPAKSRRGECLLVNPGSAFDPRTAPRGTVGLMEITPDRVELRIEEVSW